MKGTQMGRQNNFDWNASSTVPSSQEFPVRWAWDGCFAPRGFASCRQKRVRSSELRKALFSRDREKIKLRMKQASKNGTFFDSTSFLTLVVFSVSVWEGLVKGGRTDRHELLFGGEVFSAVTT